MRNERHSTTRCLINEKPSCFDNAIGGVTTLFKAQLGEKKTVEGGLRLRGYFKKGSAEDPLITVVTVVYNDEEHLEETVKSVINQDYRNVEYIVVDGGSKDGTLEVIKKYENAIDYWVSESDEGIYHAMNKGIDFGSGEWIVFMNSGDIFYSDDVLSKVFKNPDIFDGFGVIYGDHKVKYENKEKTIRAGDVSKLWRGSQFCHQAAIVSLACHKKIKFNLERSIVADYEFFYKCSSLGVKMCHLPYVFAVVSAGGVSDTKRIRSIMERYSCLDQRLIRAPYYALLVCVELAKLIVKKYVKA